MSPLWAHLFHLACLPGKELVMLQPEFPSDREDIGFQLWRIDPSWLRVVGYWSFNINSLCLEALHQATAIEDSLSYPAHQWRLVWSKTSLLTAEGSQLWANHICCTRWCSCLIQCYLHRSFPQACALCQCFVCSSSVCSSEVVLHAISMKVHMSQSDVRLPHFACIFGSISTPPWCRPTLPPCYGNDLSVSLWCRFPQSLAFLTCGTISEYGGIQHLR